MGSASSGRAECVVVTWFYPDQTGFLDFSYRIQALARDYRLTVIARAPMDQEELSIPGVEYVVIPMPDARRVRLIPYVMKALRYIARARPQLVLFLGAQLGFAPLLRVGVPVALYWNEHPTHFYPTHHPNPLIRAYCRLGRFLTYAGARKASSVLPIGEALRDDLLEHGCSRERTRLQYMGVDRSFDLAHARLDVEWRRPIRIIYAGSISETRGRDLMLQAMARVNQDVCIATLTLLGASEEQYAYCTRTAASLGIEHAVRVLRRVPGGQVPEYLRDADFGLCIWQDEEHWRFNPPTKLFEYLVAGLPVLASDIRTHTHYIRDGENGYIFDYSVHGLVEVIKKTYAARSQYRALQSNAYQAGRLFLWESIEPGFLESMSRLE